MLRLTRAPNLALATLWADALRSEGLAVSVERTYLGGVAGELPPDQCSPELWLHDAAQEARARALLDALQHLPQHCWDCACGERVEGGFASCWACGRPMPP